MGVPCQRWCYRWCHDGRRWQGWRQRGWRDMGGLPEGDLHAWRPVQMVPWRGLWWWRLRWEEERMLCMRGLQAHEGSVPVCRQDLQPLWPSRSFEGNVQECNLRRRRHIC